MSDSNEKEAPAGRGHSARGQDQRRPMVLAAVVIAMLCVLGILLIVGIAVL